MTSPLPLVSVIIPTYNQAIYLSEALDSVLQQTYPSIEVIVIDDGSTDNTSAIGRLYKETDKRIRWIEQKNQGPAHARNQAIALAQGDYICLFDSDDIMHPDRIAKQFGEFQKNPSIDICYTGLEVIDSNGQLLCQIGGQNFSPPDFLALMLFRSLISTSSLIMARSHCLKEHPYHQDFRHAEDYELMLRLAHVYHFHYLDLPLIRYRRHLTNLSNHLDAHEQNTLKVLQEYDCSHIDQVIERTTFSWEEKQLLKGRILFNQEHFEEALSIFKQLTSELTLFYQGNCLLRLNKRVKAMIAFQESVKKDPLCNAACYNNLGVAYALQGELKKAREYFQKALDLKPGYLDAQFNLQNSIENWRITWRELRPILLPYTT